jgi:hypothetical protein
VDLRTVPSLGPATTTGVVADTGSTAHFFQDLPVQNRRISSSPIAIRNPNGSAVHSTHEGEIHIPGLPASARTVHLAPDLKSHSLLSIGQLCDAGCVVSFASETVTVRHDEDNIILQGERTPATNFWHVPIPDAPIATANATVGSASPAELVAFAHSLLFSPALSAPPATALDNGCLPNFSGLSSRTLRNLPPNSAAVIKGHLDQSLKNQRSTKATTIAPDLEPEELGTDRDEFPTCILSGTRSHECFVSVIEPTGKICTDQTGKFITPSSTGNDCALC